MTKMSEIYRCEVCGNIVEVIHSGAGQLMCCNQPMVLMQENATGASEKHMPVVEINSGKISVKVGKEEHPMTDEHFIEFIEIISNGQTMKKFLRPSDKPLAEFPVEEFEKARAYCNLHGLWSSETSIKKA